MLHILFILLILSFFSSIPLMIVSGALKFLATGFSHIGIAPSFIPFVLALMLVGSFINIPLGQRHIVEVEEPYFFGLFSKRHVRLRGISLNVGGALIPVLVASFLLAKVPMVPALLATACMVIACFFLAKQIPGRGIAIPLLAPPLLAIFFSYLFAPQFVAPVSFISGVFGVLVGADLLHMGAFMRREIGMVSIGGAGAFDGIFLVGIISAFLAR